MIEVISRSFGIYGRHERQTGNEERKVGRVESSTHAPERAGDKDIFELARGIAFRARKRRIRSRGVI